ncbi:MAG: shikimate kinase [Candidatus Obscuribacterales bacterium]|nr:shikimate kinase [Candidatus Obscuribacterales bacterium]
MQVVSLIGPPGSGKSTVGKLLADKLSWAFLDSDEYIQEAESLTIAQIFKLKGEPAFRQMEIDLVTALKDSPQSFLKNKKSGLLFATGGGLPCQANNFAILQELGEIVYLTADLDILVTRVKTKSDRPLLNSKQNQATATGTENETRLLLANLIKQREHVYGRSRYKIDTSALNPEQVCNGIIELLNSG